MNDLSGQLPQEVRAAERTYTDAWRRRAGRPGDRPLTGLALSGGGIRSAVFCLGVLQALAKHDVLKNFDYLSTVSGGGYVGCSLTWFTQAGMPFGVGRTQLPYGIDDPAQPPPKDPPGKPLLPHLRRHGSYLDPGGTLSLLPGIAVVLRGVLLNLLVVWLPLVTAGFAGLRIAYRWLAAVTANTHGAWLRPWVFAAAAAAAFAVMAALYSLYSGWRARLHRNTPYLARRAFERIAPIVLGILALALVVGSLPVVSDLIRQAAAWRGNGGGVQGAIGSGLMAAGTALGLWSRFVAKGARAERASSYLGPIGAGLVFYGIALLAYALSGTLFADGRLVPDRQGLAGIGLVAAFAGLVGWFVDLNETTLHRFYRDRLMEAFMPDITADGVPTGRRAGAADAGRLRDMCDPEEPNAPYHLICCTLVLTRVGGRGLGRRNLGGRGLGGWGESRRWIDRWRIRGGDSFLLSPRYCGSRATGWHATATNKAFSEMTLPTAMAASGAAVDPNAAGAGLGPRRNRLFAALMALLNLRLGVWLPNPGIHAGKPHAPAPNHFNAGLAGVLDRLSRHGRFLEIADGGDFDNLGVYELLRRGVRTIVLCDASADPSSAFADLQTLLSRAEADFGVSISFAPPPLAPLMPAPAQARFPPGVDFAAQPFVVGSIRYPGDGSHGKLLYVKPVIFAGLRLGVLGFKEAYPDFPDDNTTDQFFDEARFEAYRELGFSCADAMLADPDILCGLRGM